MKISKVLVKNFRCFKKTDIDFQKCHALIGENGTGKTTILEAINLATSTGYAYVTEQDFNNADEGDIEITVFFDKPFLCKLPDGYYTRDILCKSVIFEAHRRRQSAAGKALSGQFVTTKYVVPLIYDSLSDLNIDSSKLQGEIPNSVKETDRGFEAPRKTGSKFKFTKQRLSLQNDLVNYPNIFYFDRDRENEAKAGFNTLLSKIIKDLNWRYRNKWNKEDIEKKWNDFYSEVIQTVIDPKNDRIMKPLSKRVKSLAGVDFSNLELSLIDIEQPFSKSFFALRDNTNQIDQKNLGSGIAIMLSFFLLEIVSNLAKGDVIFLIDEPELHLHPQLQAKFFEEFLSSKSQTIYTTQSDCMLSIADWESISRFCRDFAVFPRDADLSQVLEDKKISEHLNEIKEFHQHKAIFFREDNQLFFARKCLIVEGPAEKYALPVLSAKLDKQLGNLTIISANGKSKIPYYQLLCKAFSVPYFTLLDLDGKQADHNDNKRPYSYAEQKALVVFNSSFEDELGASMAEKHKASKVLMKVDAMDRDSISENIKKNISSICDWVVNDV